MPDTIQNIPSVLISQDRGFAGAEAGKFENLAYIRAINMDFGINEKPTSLNLGLINQNGIYDPTPNLDYTSPYYLKIGDDLTIKCYVKGFKKNTSSSDKTLELELTDGSHILDRVFIGLIGTHTLDEKFLTKPLGEVDNTAIIPLSCPPCFQNNQIGPVNAQGVQILNAIGVDFYNYLLQNSPADIPANPIPINPIFTQRLLREANLNKCFTGNTVDGGYIFLGKEKFTKTSCDLAAVDYSFFELKEACRFFGIDINIFDKSEINGVSYLRKNFTGTLRKVLNDWCALFGCTFYYDFAQELATANERPTVGEIDLNSPARGKTLDQISSTAKLIKAGDDALIESISESKNLEGTFKKSLITSYKRKRTLRSYNKTTYYGTAYKCFTSSDLLLPKFRSYRSEQNFNASCYLAKYNTNIRTLFNTFLAGNDLALGLGGNVYGCLGLQFIAHIDANLRQEIIDDCLDTETYQDIIDRFTVPYQIPDVDMFLALYSPDLAERHLEFEKNWAENVMGKYFYTNLNTFADEKYGGYKVCFTGSDWRYEAKSSLTPEPVDVSNSNKEASTSLQTRGFITERLPFAKYLWGPIPINPWGQSAADPRLKIFERSNAPWSITQEQADDYFTTKTNVNGNTNDGTKDLAEPFLPKFQKISGMIETRLRARFKGTAVDINGFLDLVKEDSTPVLVIAPKPARIGQILKVGDSNTQRITTQPNFKESPFWNSKGSSDQQQIDCSKSLACEIQSSLEEEVCKPSNYCGYQVFPPSAVDPTTAFGKIYAAKEGEPFPEGVANLLGGGLTINFWPPRQKGQNYSIRGSLTIVGPAGTAITPNPLFPATVPLNNLYLANYKEDIKSAYYQDKVEQFLGATAKDFGSVGNVSEVQIELNNLDTDSPIFNSKDPVTGNVLTITNIYVQGVGFLTIEEYHELLRKNVQLLGHSSPKQNVSVDFGSLNYGTLGQYLNVQKGLVSFSAKVDQNGSSATASWTNRPAKPPAQDLFTQEIEPKLLSRNILRS